MLIVGDNIGTHEVGKHMLEHLIKACSPTSMLPPLLQNYILAFSLVHKVVFFIYLHVSMHKQEVLLLLYAN